MSLICRSSSWACTFSSCSPVCQVSILAFHTPIVCVLLTYLGIILADATILMSRNNVLAQITPSGNSSLAILARNLQTRLVRLLIQVVSLAISILHIKHHNRAQVAHTLLRHGQKLTSIGTEFNPFHGGGELPYFDTFAGLDVP